MSSKFRLFVSYETKSNLEVLKIFTRKEIFYLLSIYLLYEKSTKRGTFSSTYSLVSEVNKSRHFLSYFSTVTIFYLKNYFSHKKYVLSFWNYKLIFNHTENMYDYYTTRKETGFDHPRLDWLSRAMLMTFLLHFV